MRFASLIDTWLHRLQSRCQVPSNDGGFSLGLAVVAASQAEDRRSLTIKVGDYVPRLTRRGCDDSG